MPTVVKNLSAGGFVAFTSTLSRNVSGHGHVLDPTQVRNVAASGYAAELASASGAYAAAVMADAPLLYWRFNDADGSRPAGDSSGYGREGTWILPGNLTYGATGLVEPDGAGNRAIRGSFGAGARRIESGLGLVGWSLSFGADPLEAPSGTQPPGIVLGIGDARAVCCPGPGGSLELYAEGDLGTPTIAVAADTPGHPLGGGWRHWGLAWDGATLRLYRDGVLAGSATPAGLSGTDLRLEAGLSSEAIVAAHFADFYAGGVDEVALFGQTLGAGRFAAQAGAAQGGRRLALGADGYVEGLFGGTLDDWLGGQPVLAPAVGLASGEPGGELEAWLGGEPWLVIEDQRAGGGRLGVGAGAFIPHDVAANAWVVVGTAGEAGADGLVVEGPLGVLADGAVGGAGRDVPLPHAARLTPRIPAARPVPRPAE